MKATTLIERYRLWLKARKLVPKFHVDKAITCIRYKDPGDSPIEMVRKRKKNSSKAFIHTMGLLESFLVDAGIKKIQNDIPDLSSIRKKFWSVEANRKNVLNRYLEKKNEPSVSWRTIKSHLQDFPVKDAAVLALLAFQGFRREQVLLLRSSEINFQNRTINLNGKEVILFSSTKKYLKVFQSVHEPSGSRFFGKDLTARQITNICRRFAFSLNRDPKHLTSNFWRFNIIGIMWRNHGADFTIHQFNIKHLREILPHINKPKDEPDF